MLKEREPGIKTVDVCRTHGILSATLCKWKAKYGGMTLSQSCRAARPPRI